MGLVATFLLLAEPRNQKNPVDIRKTISAIWSAAMSRRFLAIGGFIACLQFGVVPPLIYYLTDVLKFDAQFLGILGAFGSLASGLGAFA
jgi:hypothetical protein